MNGIKTDWTTMTREEFSLKYKSWARCNYRMRQVKQLFNLGE